MRLFPVEFFRVLVCITCKLLLSLVSIFYVLLEPTGNSYNCIIMKSIYFSQSNIIKRLKSINTVGNTDIIQYLDCSNWDIGPYELSSLSDAIQSINLSSDNIHPLIGIDLSNNCLSGISSFQISNTYDYEGINKFVNSLMNISKFSRIKKINLQRNQLNDNGFELISMLLSSNGLNSLQELILRECNSTSEGIKYIAKQLENNHSLFLLDVSYNSINTNGCNYISDSLKYNKLKTLILEHCQITTEGLNNICISLTNNYNNTLTTLNLSNNDLNDSGAEVIGNSLKNINYLTHLELQDNQITNYGFKLLINGLIKNNSLVFIGLRFNLLTDDFIDDLNVLYENNNNLKAIYLFGNLINIHTLNKFINQWIELKNKKLEIDLIAPSFK